MSDDQTPERTDTPETNHDTPVAETKSGKKAKADKKKSAAAAPVPAEAEATVSEEQPAAGAPTDRPVAAPTAVARAGQDLFQQGVQSLLHGEYDAADTLFGQALTTYRKQDDRAGQIDVLEQLGHLCFLRGAEAQAREYYQQAGLMRATH